VITEEMLRAAAVRSSEIYVAHLEKGINRHEFSPEFEKSIQDIVEGGKAMTDERKEYLLRCWENEVTAEDEEWRDGLTEEEQELVDRWDVGYTSGCAKMVVAEKITDAEIVKWLRYCADEATLCGPGCECPFFDERWPAPEEVWCVDVLMKEAAKRLEEKYGR
jgi:hypothetical protein